MKPPDIITARFQDPHDVSKDCERIRRPVGLHGSGWGDLDKDTGSIWAARNSIQKGLVKGLRTKYYKLNETIHPRMKPLAISRMQIAMQWLIHRIF